LSGRSALSLIDLKETPFILFDHGFALHRIILVASHLAGFEPDIVACSSQTDFMIELVDAGLGVTFMPRIIADNTHKPGICSIALDEPSCDWLMTMAWRRGGYLSLAANAWLDLVREFHHD
jgi:DNA-binding transcriptional LysR family regulator